MNDYLWTGKYVLSWCSGHMLFVVTLSKMLLKGTGVKIISLGNLTLNHHSVDQRNVTGKSVKLMKIINVLHILVSFLHN